MDPQMNNNWSNNPLGMGPLWTFEALKVSPKKTMFTTQTLGNKICQLENDHGNLALNDRLNEPGGRIMIHLKSQIGVASSHFVSAFIPR